MTNNSRIGGLKHMLPRFAAMVLALTTFSQPLAADTEADPAALRQQAVEATARGDFDAQIESWSRLIRHHRASGDGGSLAAALHHRAESYLAAGRYPLAIADLQQLSGNEQTRDEPAALAAVLNSLGTAYGVSARNDDAAQALDEALRAAQASEDPQLLAVTHNNRGNLFATLGEDTLAAEAFDNAIAFATRSGNQTLSAKASINLARLLWSAQKTQAARAQLQKASASLASSSANESKATLLLSLGRLYQQSGLSDSELAGDLLSAHKAFSDARDIAGTLGNTRLSSYANGYLGNLYEENRQDDEAIAYTQQAILEAQRLDAPELSYQWQWQKGRLYAGRDALDAAIAAYRQASFSLEKIRDDLGAYYRARGSAYQTVVGPMYLELADLLLQRASASGDNTLKQSDLREARQKLEQARVAELQDYFLDPCVTRAQAKATGLEAVAGDTAILYPVLLKDRTELLISLKSGIEQVTVPIAGDRITAEIREFRRNLENAASRQYFIQARQLYDWLLGPAENILAENDVETLVVIPGGPFRTIPFAALNDGKQYLIEKYAVVYTPGLTLTDASPLTRANLRVLVNGLTESVRGYPALPAVSDEVDSIQSVIDAGDETVLLDKAFVVPNIETELTGKPYNVVHIASHGLFERDVRNSFILTYDDKLTMDALEDYMQIRRFSDDSIELLTLSACQTAAGDDRAALGLAGVAIKAGARSALGTLWYISDRATSQLIADFYRELFNAQTTKARALQNAQVKILQNPDFEHPVYWAPYLLIGNWL